MVAPDVYLYKEHRRHGERLAIEDSRHYFATAPFYLFLVIHHALPGCQHIILCCVQHKDDVITKGLSYATYANQLESLGANVLGGIFLARTHYKVK